MVVARCAVECNKIIRFKIENVFCILLKVNPSHEMNFFRQLATFTKTGMSQTLFFTLKRVCKNRFCLLLSAHFFGILHNMAKASMKNGHVKILLLSFSTCDVIVVVHGVTCQFPFSSCFALICFFLFLFPVISLLVNHHLVFSPVFH